MDGTLERSERHQILKSFLSTIFVVPTSGSFREHGSPDLPFGSICVRIVYLTFLATKPSRTHSVSYVVGGEFGPRRVKYICSTEESGQFRKLYGKANYEILRLRQHCRPVNVSNTSLRFYS